MGAKPAAHYLCKQIICRNSTPGSQNHDHKFSFKKFLFTVVHLYLLTTSLLKKISNDFIAVLKRFVCEKKRSTKIDTSYDLTVCVNNIFNIQPDLTEFIIVCFFATPTEGIVLFLFSVFFIVILYPKENVLCYLQHSHTTSY